MKEKDHPYPEPNAIYAALLDVVSNRAARFENAVKLYSSSDRSRILQDETVLVANQLDRITDVFGLVDRVDSSRIPFEILRALSWAATALLNENCRAVVRLDGAYNYSITSCRGRFAEFGWTKAWAKATVAWSSGQPFTILVLGFPSAHAGSILLHALSAHELGHQLLNRYVGEFERVREEAVSAGKAKHLGLLTEFIDDNIRKREGLRPKDAHAEASRHVEALLGKLADDWLGELFADLVAATLVGPAFLAAFDEIALERTTASLSHPPGSLRRRLVREYLQEHVPAVASDPTWVRVFEVSEEASDPLFGPRVEDGDTNKPLYDVGQTICRAGLTGLSRVLSKLPSPLKIKELETVVDTLEKYIENLAPPSSAFPASRNTESDDFWLLMYSAWHFRLSGGRFDRFKRRHGLDDAAAEHAIGNLLVHSLQSIELRHRWKEANMPGKQQGAA